MNNNFCIMNLATDLYISAKTGWFTFMIAMLFHIKRFVLHFYDY